MKSAKLQTKPTIRLDAKLFRTLLTLPKSASAKLPLRNTTMIEGTINCIPFRAALGSNGKGGHQFKMSKAMRGAVGANIGDTATVEITRIADEPETRMPSDLRKALAATPRARGSWTDITPLARRDWIFSICTAKQAGTRKRRIEKTCDMLAGGHRRLCCFPGIKQVMKKNAGSCGMWLPLATSKR